MLVECPKCRKESCPVSGADESQTVEHVCPHCRKVIQIEAGQVTAGPAAPARRTAKRGQATILVVDDTATIRAIAEDILSSEGYAVLKAADGVEALKLAHQELPNLIVLDLVMPRMTGSDVIREIRKVERLKSTPILVITGIIPEPQVRAELRQYGVTEFITKTHLMTALASRVAELLARPIDQAV